MIFARRLITKARRPIAPRHAVFLLSTVLMAVSCARPAEPTSNEPAPDMPTDALVFDFEQDSPGVSPAGFTAALTGGGGPVRWETQEVPDAASGSHVVTQLSDDRTNTRFPHLVRDDFAARDVDVSVRFKTISGRVDASGGLVFRYRDSGNFYVVRANALEGNVVAYKTENGRRSSIGVKGAGNAYGVNIDVPHKAWNTLRVIMTGNTMQIYFNGRHLFDVQNDTFAGPGKIGLWTKADAVTQFDDLRVASLDEPREEAAKESE